MKRLFWAMASALLLISTAATPAQADNGPSSFNWMSCAPGTYTGYYSEAYMVTTSIVMRGKMYPCRSWPTSRDVYGLGVYRADGTAIGKAAAFVGDDAPILPDFQANIDMRAFGPNVVAVCLIASETLRLDCVNVTTTVTNGVYSYAVGARLATDSPLVSARAYTNLRKDGSWVGLGPQCPACWGDPNVHQ